MGGTRWQIRGIKEGQDQRKKIAYQEADERQKDAIEAIQARNGANQEDYRLTAASEGDSASTPDTKTDKKECKAVAVQAGTLRSGKRRRPASIDRGSVDHIVCAEPTKRGGSRRAMPKRAKKH